MKITLNFMEICLKGNFELFFVIFITALGQF